MADYSKWVAPENLRELIRHDQQLLERCRGDMFAVELIGYLVERVMDLERSEAVLVLPFSQVREEAGLNRDRVVWSMHSLITAGLIVPNQFQLEPGGKKFRIRVDLERVISLAP